MSEAPPRTPSDTADAWESRQFLRLLEDYRLGQDADTAENFERVRAFCREHDGCVRILAAGLPPAGAPVDHRLYNEAMVEIERLTELIGK
jgi:hypothetical protein